VDWVSRGVVVVMTLWIILCPLSITGRRIIVDVHAQQTRHSTKPNPPLADTDDLEQNVIETGKPAWGGWYRRIGLGSSMNRAWSKS
jgi:hypothetical protein